MRQKQVIGRVGKSGVATGPHLDYRVKKDGRFVNPFALKFRPRSALSGAGLQGFQGRLEEVRKLLKTMGERRDMFVGTVEFMKEPEGWIG